MGNLPILLEKHTSLKIDVSMLVDPLCQAALIEIVFLEAEVVAEFVE